jgi:hypothetical protein
MGSFTCDAIPTCGGFGSPDPGSIVARNWCRPSFHHFQDVPGTTLCALFDCYLHDSLVILLWYSGDTLIYLCDTSVILWWYLVIPVWYSGGRLVKWIKKLRWQFLRTRICKDFEKVNWLVSCVKLVHRIWGLGAELSGVASGEETGRKEW